MEYKGKEGIVTRKTHCYKEANQMLADGWKLISVEEGNIGTVKNLINGIVYVLQRKEDFVMETIMNKLTIKSLLDELKDADEIENLLSEIILKELSRYENTKKQKEKALRIAITKLFEY